MYTNRNMKNASTGEMSAVFFFQAEDGIRDSSVTGVQTCALPISRAVQLFFLNSKFAFSLRKLFVSKFPIKSYYVRSKFLKLLREHDAPFCVVFALQFVDAFRGTLHQVGKPNAELDHPLVVVVVKRLRYNSALVEHGPEFVSTARIIMPNTDGGLARIPPHEYQLLAFAPRAGHFSLNAN